MKSLKTKKETQERIDTNPFYQGGKHKSIELDSEYMTNDIPQYYDMFDKPNRNYRHIFKPKITIDQDINDDTNEMSKIYFSTPQELRLSKKRKLLHDLNFTINKLKDNETNQLSDSFVKKVRFTDHPPPNTSPKSNEKSNKIRKILPRKTDEEEKDDGFITCPEGCGRRFAPIALAKHVKICKNVFLSQKEPFDTARQRKLKESKDLENRMRLQEKEVTILKERIEILKKEKELKEQEKNRPENFPKWKKQSEALRAVMKDSKGNFHKYDSEFIREGLNKDKYVKCEGCGRLFNEKAAERHVETCLQRINNLKLHKKRMII